MSEASDIVPDHFDLDDALNANSSTPADERPQCPECNGHVICKKTERGRELQNRKAGAYRCENPDCGAHFDQPRNAEATPDGR